MIWPFRRTPTPPSVIDARCMNEDWRTGDLAECICDDWVMKNERDPKVGEVLRVTEVMDRVGVLNTRCYFLAFEGKPSGHGWCCTSFRKLRPVHEPASADFRAFLKDRLNIREVAA